MLTSFDVIDAAIRRKPCKRYGFMDSPWQDTMAKWITQGYPTNENGGPVHPPDHFGFDMEGAGGFFEILPIRGHNEVVEETDEWVVRRNGAGASLKWWKSKSGTPEHIDFRMTSREIWECDYRRHLLSFDEKRIDWDGAVKNIARLRGLKKWSYFGNLFVWENMRQSMGDICLYESMLLDPEWIHDHNRVYTDFFKVHYQALFDRVGLPDGMWMYEDMGYKNAMFCSPKMYEKLIFPYYREMVEFYHARNLPVVLHTCGLVEPILDLIVEAGFDALNPMEVKAGNDPLRIARRYGDRLAFIGGLDARVLESHDHKLIRSQVERLLKGMRDAGASFVFASDHSISTNVDYQDYLCAVEAYKEFAEE